MLHFLGADLIRLSHVRGDWWIRGKGNGSISNGFLKKKGSTYICPNHGANLNLIPQGRYLPGLAGSLERNEWDKRERGELYNTTCSLIYLWELNWVWIHTSESKIASACWNSLAFQMCCGGNRPRPYKCWTRIQQQCHSCAWVVIFTRPIIGSQMKIKILAGQCSTQFELDGMGKRKQVLLLCWISVGKTQNQEGANNHHMCL